MKIRGLLALAALASLLGAPALGAQVPADSTRRAGSGNGNAQPAQAAALDRPVSRTEYLLGPGDVLSVALFGEVTDQFTVPVTPEGTVIVPTVGFTSVLGLNLNQAEARIRTLVGRYYRDLEVSVTLSAIRPVKVYVVGDVTPRGVRYATATTRVSEILDPSGGRPIQRRNVVLRHANGDSVTLDLVRFVQTGDLRNNPTLREGDAVVVPVQADVMSVYGRVAYPGRYDHRPGETLAEFLTVVNGGAAFARDAGDTIRLTRFRGNERYEVITLTQAEALGARGRGLVLQPFDALFVPGVVRFRETYTATVTGEVRYPGTYPIQEGVTTVRELVRMAGGFTPEASLSDATLLRTRDVREGTGTRELLNAPESSLTDEEREIRAITVGSGGVAYVGIDLDQIFAAGSTTADPRLQTGDLLNVPRRRNEVLVMGAVLRPGIVEYRHGLTLEQYVRLAGGFSERADRRELSVIKAARGNRVGPRDAWYPEPGDQVVVPFRERRSILERVQGASAVAGTISSALLAVLAITRIF